MRHRCLAEQELAVLLELPPDAPQRREAEDCGRCASLLASMSAFLAGDSDLSAAEAHRADQRLTAFVAEHLARTPAERQPGRGRIIGRLGRPGWPLGAALAAVAATVILVVGQIPGTGTGPSGILRGGAGVPATAVIGELVITGIPDDPAGGLQVAWPVVPGADQYEIILFSAALDTLSVLGLLAEPAVTVPGTLLLRGDPEGTLCRVRALAAGVPIAASRLRQLNNP